MTTVLDIQTADKMQQILEAFERFNDDLANISGDLHAFIFELTEAVVTNDGKEFCRVFYTDGAAYVQPIAKTTREVSE